MDNQASSTRNRTRSLAFVALTVAILAISSWITVPFGPIPFTLQTFAVSFAIVLLPPRQAIASIFCYIGLGAIGVPVFSGMRGGFGVLVGPTGGYLWGYLLGVTVGSLFLAYFRERTTHTLPFEISAAIIYSVIADTCGCLMYSIVMGVSIEVAFFASIVPFIGVDLAKIVAATFCARAVRKALGMSEVPAITATNPIGSTLEE